MVDVPRHIPPPLAVYGHAVLKLEEILAAAPLQLRFGYDRSPIFRDDVAFADRPRRKKPQPVRAALHPGVFVQQSFHGVI
jgi:hypothetical protein